MWEREAEVSRGLTIDDAVRDNSRRLLFFHCESSLTDALIDNFLSRCPDGAYDHETAQSAFIPGYPRSLSPSPRNSPFPYALLPPAYHSDRAIEREADNDTITHTSLPLLHYCTPCRVTHCPGACAKSFLRLAIIASDHPIERVPETFSSSVK